MAELLGGRGGAPARKLRRARPRARRPPRPVAVSASSAAAVTGTVLSAAGRASEAERRQQRRPQPRQPRSGPAGPAPLGDRVGRAAPSPAPRSSRCRRCRARPILLTPAEARGAGEPSCREAWMTKVTAGCVRRPQSSGTAPCGRNSPPRGGEPLNLAMGQRVWAVPGPPCRRLSPSGNDGVRGPARAASPTQGTVRRNPPGARLVHAAGAGARCFAEVEGLPREWAAGIPAHREALVTRGWARWKWAD